MRLFHKPPARRRAFACETDLSVAQRHHPPAACAAGRRRRIPSGSQQCSTAIRPAQRLYLGMAAEHGEICHHAMPGKPVAEAARNASSIPARSSSGEGSLTRRRSRSQRRTRSPAERDDSLQHLAETRRRAIPRTRPGPGRAQSRYYRDAAAASTRSRDHPPALTSSAAARAPSTPHRQRHPALSGRPD